MLEFASGYKDIILRELEFIKDDDGKLKWKLELSNTALFSLLSTFGEDHPSMEVICDESKPLEEIGDFFDVMIGRKDRIYQGFFDRERLLTFNLKEQLRLVSSRDHPGVQLADVISGSVTYALLNKNDNEAQEWLSSMEDSLHPDSLVPDQKHIDIDIPEVYINATIMAELGRRARIKADPLEGLEALWELSKIRYIKDFGGSTLHDKP